jgi:hypothetical protein
MTMWMEKLLKQFIRRPFWRSYNPWRVGVYAGEEFSFKSGITYIK